MTDTQPVQIEYEDENQPEESVEVKAQPETKLTIGKKKVSELSEQEKLQLVADAKNGIENEFFSVKLFKNGNSRITLRKQSKPQELIKANENNHQPTSTAKYLTDNQLLFEHIINLETLFGKLHAKHKKLKKRYNELEGYLYADDSDDEDKPKQQVQQQPPQQQYEQVQQQQQYEQAQPNPYIQRRYVRSWRQIQPIQNQ